MKVILTQQKFLVNYIIFLVMEMWAEAILEVTVLHQVLPNFEPSAKFSCNIHTAYSSF